MDFLLIVVSLLFIVQIVTNVILVVRILPKRKVRQQINISDIMSYASQIVGDKDEHI